jgi:ribosomal protein L32
MGSGLQAPLLGIEGQISDIGVINMAKIHLVNCLTCGEPKDPNRAYHYGDNMIGGENRLLCNESCYDTYARDVWGYKDCHFCERPQDDDVLIDFEGHKICNDLCIDYYKDMLRKRGDVCAECGDITTYVFDTTYNDKKICEDCIDNHEILE